MNIYQSKDITANDHTFNKTIQNQTVKKNRIYVDVFYLISKIVKLAKKIIFISKILYSVFTKTFFICSNLLLKFDRIVVISLRKFKEKKKSKIRLLC